MTGEFHITIRIAVTPGQVFPYLVEPDQLIRWMGTDAIVDPRSGGRYDLVVNGLGISGHVEVYDHPNVWSSPGATSTAPTSTRRQHRRDHPHPEGPETIVELTHRGLNARQVRDLRVGRLHWLERLRSTAAGGDPGPDTPPASPADHQDG